MIEVGCVIYHVLLRPIVLVVVLSFSSLPLRLQMRMMVCPLPWFCFISFKSDVIINKAWIRRREI